MVKVKLLGKYKSHKAGDIITVGKGEIAYLKGMNLYSEYVAKPKRSKKVKSTPSI